MGIAYLAKTGNAITAKKITLPDLIINDRSKKRHRGVSCAAIDIGLILAHCLSGRTFEQCNKSFQSIKSIRRRMDLGDLRHKLVSMHER